MSVVEVPLPEVGLDGDLMNAPFPPVRAVKHLACVVESEDEGVAA